MMRGRYSSLQAKDEAVLTPLGVPCPGMSVPSRTIGMKWPREAATSGTVTHTDHETRCR